jgi:cation diffusion facilitator family transporter
MLGTKSRAAALSVGSNSVLILLKIVAGLMTGSISLIAEAVHSTMDLAAAIIAFFSVRISDSPADEEHPFGHGKAENISAIAEALLIFAAAGIIVYEAVHRIIAGSSLQFVDIGIGMMALSIVVNLLVSRYLLKVSRNTDSLALEADARHLTTDVVTMVGVLVGLGIVRVTKLNIFDPVAAILVALLITKAAYDITRKSFGGLMDTRLPKAEEDTITSVINEHTGELAGFHEMRTRKAGSHRFIDLHLVLPNKVGLEQAHRMCDHLEEDIKSRLPNSSVTIHVEPCTTRCGECKAVCDFRRRC